MFKGFIHYMGFSIIVFCSDKLWLMFHMTSVQKRLLQWKSINSKKSIMANINLQVILLSRCQMMQNVLPRERQAVFEINTCTVSWNLEVWQSEKQKIWSCTSAYYTLCVIHVWFWWPVEKKPVYFNENNILNSFSEYIQYLFSTTNRGICVFIHTEGTFDTLIHNIWWFAHIS